MKKKEQKENSSVEENENNNLLVNANHVSKIFNVGRSTFDKLRKRASFPKAIYLTNRPMWKTSEVLSWLDSMREPSGISNDLAK